MSHSRLARRKKLPRGKGKAIPPSGKPSARESGAALGWWPVPVPAAVPAPSRSGPEAVAHDYGRENFPSAEASSALYRVKSGPEVKITGFERAQAAEKKAVQEERLSTKAERAKRTVLYLVSGPKGLKLGTTNGDGKTRLADHYRAGYTEVDRLVTGLAVGVAADIEMGLKRTLRAAGFKPARGAEYFNAGAMHLTLAFVDAALSHQGSTEGRSWPCQ